MKVFMDKERDGGGICFRCAEKGGEEKKEEEKGTGQSFLIYRYVS